MIDKKFIGIGAVIVVIILAVSIMGSGAFGSNGNDKDKGEKLPDVQKSLDISGTVQEGESMTKPIGLVGKMIHKVDVTFTWEDDMSGSDPDTFKVTIEGAGHSETQTGSDGTITMSIDLRTGESTSIGGSGNGGCCTPGTAYEEDDKAEINGTWVMTVSLEEAGDEPVGPIGMVVYIDDSNSWSATVDYTVCGSCEEGAGCS